MPGERQTDPAYSFIYTWRCKTRLNKQYASNALCKQAFPDCHASAKIVLTQDGDIASRWAGVRFLKRDHRLAESRKSAQDQLTGRLWSHQERHDPIRPRPAQEKRIVQVLWMYVVQQQAVPRRIQAVAQSSDHTRDPLQREKVCSVGYAQETDRPLPARAQRTGIGVRTITDLSDCSFDSFAGAGGNAIFPTIDDIRHGHGRHTRCPCHVGKRWRRIS